jgi:hypothetical protein
MWFFNLFASDIACPRCGDPAARRAVWGTVKCPNRNCEHFSQELVDYREEARWAAELRTAKASGEVRSHRDPRTGEKIYRKIRNVPATGFDPGQHRIDVVYVNFNAEQKTFTGDWRTLRRRGRHVSLQVLPTGVRIALAIDRIQNIGDVELGLQRCPTSQERRVMNYHARRGTSSARYQDLRRKYPNWSPIG